MEICIDIICVPDYNDKVVKKSCKQFKMMFDNDDEMLYSKIRRKK